MIKNYYGLYIHIPICNSICRYCDFYKVTNNQWIGSDLYLEALEKDLCNLPKNFLPKTIFIGGGTPTALSANDYKKMLLLIHKYIDINNVEEWTTEANPQSIDSEKIEVMLEGGINRISVGIQSFSNNALKLLGRNHDNKKAIDTIELLQSYNFDDISIDMIQSIPGMTKSDIRNELDIISQFHPDHISFYNLIYEAGTPLTKDRDNRRFKTLTDENELEIYLFIQDGLEKLGYDHYEISNFSKNNKICIHNLLYWTGGEYIGCGPSAHSHWNNVRFSKISDLKQYYHNLLNDKSIINMREKLSPFKKAKETLIMWLRLSSGVNLSEFKIKTGFEIKELYSDEIEYLLKNNLLELVNNYLRIPKDKRFLSNSVFIELI